MNYKRKKPKSRYRCILCNYGRFEEEQGEFTRQKRRQLQVVKEEMDKLKRKSELNMIS